MNKLATVLVVSLVAASGSLSQAGEQVSDVSQQTNIAVTIYNNNLALIKDTRRIELPVGQATLAFREISAQIKPETAVLKSLTAADKIQLLEQNFNFDLLSPRTLLKKYVGRQVKIVKTHPRTGEESFMNARVLSTHQGVVLRSGDHIETGVPGRLVFPDVPDNLRDRPTLTLELQNRQAGPQNVELTYLSQGLGWKADYVAELQEKNKLNLSGLVTLTNTSGTDYRNAQLQLVAGDVHQVRPERPRLAAPRVKTLAMQARDVAMQREALFEYHLYSLPRRTTIAHQQSKQIALLNSRDIPYSKEFRLQGNSVHYMERQRGGTQKQKVGVYLNINNKKQDGLGLPLPRGVVRVYQKDTRGHAQFIGEDRIDHTPENEILRLKMGDAFDITAKRKQTDFKKIAGSGPYDYVYETTFDITLRNAKEEATEILVIEPLPGDWQILDSSSPFQRESAHQARWKISVPAKGSHTLTYRARVRI